VPFEIPELAPPGPREMRSDFGSLYAVNGLVAFIFATTGPVAIILAIGRHSSLSAADISSWMFGAFFLNGLISLAFCWLYRQPLVFLWTIPGAVLIGPALGHLSFAEVIGAYYVTGLLMLVLGASGLVRRAMQAAVMPIVMGMVAGVFLRFDLDMVHALRDDFWIAAPMVAAFLALSASPRFGRYIPPLIGALAAGAVALALLHRFQPGSAALFAFAHPTLYTPVFSWRAMVELVVPLAITVLAVQNGQGYAVLGVAGHKPPVNAVTIACGAGSILCALVGSVSTCLTGPVNAIISTTGERTRQYTSGLLVGLLVIAFGALAPTFTRLMMATPQAFIATLGGLAMLRVLQTSFITAFRTTHTFGALVTFIVTIANVPIFNIGAPFWGLVIGYLCSRLLEPGDFSRTGNST
jgi:benzoate membrane transport protein